MKVCEGNWDLRTYEPKLAKIKSWNSGFLTYQCPSVVEPKAVEGRGWPCDVDARVACLSQWWLLADDF